ncbi:MAG: hypothetical protein ACR2GY_13560 [Phycisphaerales bacterium]
MNGDIDIDPATIDNEDELFDRIGAIADGCSVLVLKIKLKTLPPCTPPPPGGGGVGGDPDTVTIEIKHTRAGWPASTQTAEFIGSLWLHDSAALDFGFPDLPAPDEEGGGRVFGDTSVEVDAPQDEDEIIVFYRPPNNFYFGKSHKQQELLVEVSAQGELRAEVNFDLVRPPLMSAHGVTSNQANMLEMQNLLIVLSGGGVKTIFFDWFDQNGVGNTSGYDEVALLLKQQIETELDTLRVQRIAATRIDYFGHSMGGVVAKWLASDITPQNSNRVGGFPALIWPPGPHFRRADNFGQGEFRRLITVGSPFRGSPLADKISQDVGWTILIQICKQQPESVWQRRSSG